MNPIKAIIVFDPNRKSDKASRESSGLSEEEALAEARLLYYFAACQVDMAERRSQSSLIQGVVEFSTFVSLDKGMAGKPLSIETEQLLYLVTEIDKSKIFLTIIFDRKIVSENVSHMILSKFIDYYFLLHGKVVDQLNAGYPLSVTMDDFVTSFISAECSDMTKKLYPVSIRYAPVEAHALVAVHALGLEILTEFQNDVSDFAILYRGYLVSSSIDPKNLSPLYSYIALNSNTGEVSNTKLLRPPYGRIGTAAIALGGGSSAFGRCNFFDSDNSSNGFLFGPTGSGEAVFCPQIFLKSQSRYLVAYLINGVLVVALTRECPEYTLLKRLETYLVDNSELNDETLSILRSDFAKASAISREDKFDFTYLNNQTKSLITLESSGHRKDLKRGSSFFASSRFMTPFGSTSFSQEKSAESKEDDLRGRMDRLVAEQSDIANLAVKASTNDGWKVYIRRGQDREMRFDFKDPKLPLWKVNSEIAHFLKVRFDSVVL